MVTNFVLGKLTSEKFFETDALPSHFTWPADLPTSWFLQSWAISLLSPSVLSCWGSLVKTPWNLSGMPAAPHCFQYLTYGILHLVQITTFYSLRRRITFGIGCILPLSVFWFRLNIANSRRYREEAITSRVPYALSFRRYWKRLLGSAGCWFLYDFVVFPNGTISSTIINSFVPDKSLLKTAEYQFLMTLLSFPGILLGAWAVDKYVWLIAKLVFFRFFPLTHPL